MEFEVELPDLGTDGGDTATVAEWFYEEGEFVEEGETLLEVLSESDSIAIPCPRSGTLIERLVAEDEIARIGEPLAILECPADEEDEGRPSSKDDEAEE